MHAGRPHYSSGKAQKSSHKHGQQGGPQQASLPPDRAGLHPGHSEADTCKTHRSVLGHCRPTCRASLSAHQSTVLISPADAHTVFSVATASATCTSWSVCPQRRGLAASLTAWVTSTQRCTRLSSPSKTRDRITHHWDGMWLEHPKCLEQCPASVRRTVP